jgi:hypothetical protein
VSLKGSLETIALPDVLNLLAGTSKSGELHVQGGRGEGRLWFDAGILSGFEVGRTHEPADAVFEMLRLQDGQFTFIPDAVAPESAEIPCDDSRDIHPALETAQGRFAEWTEIVSVVPSLDHHLRLVTDGDDGQVVLERSQWGLAVAIGSGQSVRNVLLERDLSEFEGCKALKSLVDAALAEVSDPAVVEGAVAEGADPVAGPDDFEGAHQAEPVGDDVEPASEGADPVAGPDDFEGADQAEPVGDDVEPASPWSMEPPPLASAWLSWGAAADGHDPHDEVNDDEPARPDGLDVPSPVDGEAQSPDLEADSEQAGTEVSAVTVSWGEVSGVQASGDEVSETEPGMSDHYSALWAAAVEASGGPSSSRVEGAGEAADNHVVDEEAGVPRLGDEEPDSDEPDDGRSALLALLDEVTAQTSEPAPQAQAVDGLLDSGPWTSNELAGLEQMGGWADADADAGSDAEGIHPGAELDCELEAEAEAEAEPEPVAEEPINRGLLLKFLSSVRN